VELAKVAQESGAAAVTVHGRTREQFYSGHADWDCIAAVKAAVRIPVIGNGDAVSQEIAGEMRRQTGCDYVMVGRGALGNPWLFAEEGPLPDWPQKIATALRHARMAIDHKGPRTGLLEMRKHFGWYIKGLPQAAKLRVRINRATSYAEMESLLTQACATEAIL